MINTSSTYKQLLLNGKCQWAASATVTFANGSTLALDNSNIMENGLSISDGTSAQYEFSIGAFVSKMLTLKIKNFDGAIDESRLSGAQIDIKDGLVTAIDPSTGAKTYEWIPWGKFYVDRHSEANGIITVTAYDSASLFEEKYDSTLSYPASLYTILNDACNKCGATLYTTSFTNSDYVVAERPSDDATTYADIVSDAAQLAGCWARISNLNQLVLGWYDTDRLYQDTGDIISGGTFTGAATDVLSGGSFTDTPADILCGGVFRSGLYAPEIKSFNSCSIRAKDIMVTGVQIIPYNDDLSTVFCGANGYVVSIEKNPLAQSNLSTLVNNIGNKLIGFHFRPMEISALSDPSIEAGDVATLIGTRGSRYPTIISNLDYSQYDFEKFSADAETESENNSTHYGMAAKAIQAAKDKSQRQISDYDKATNAFASMAALAMGLFFTRQQLDDGSYIQYWHDKPTLAESQTIWKLNQNVFVTSDDGGETYHGMSADGNILAKVLTAIGILADWIKIGGSGVNGKLKVLDSANNEILILDNRGITMQNGAKLIGGNGVISTFVFESSGEYSGFQEIGWSPNGGAPHRLPLFHYIYIPAGLTIVSATMTVDIMSRYHVHSAADSVPTGYYTASNIAAYYAKQFSTLYSYEPSGAEPVVASGSLNQISAFGTYSPSASSNIQSKSVDVTNCVAAGQKTLFSLTAGADTYSSGKEITDSAYAKITVVVEGFVAG